MNEQNTEVTPTACGDSKGLPYNFKDETGKRFGRLTVIRREGKNISNQTTWRCLCDCGNETVQAGISMRSGVVVSCGCYHREITATINYKHGHSQQGPYRSWKELIRRCTVETHASWASHGGRGIKVCQRWLDSVENFIADMGSTWKKGLWIERRDNNGDYTPENCYWATPKEQNNNKRDNRRLEHEGRIQTMTQWAEERGMSCQALKNRLDAGWSVERALNTPIRKCKNQDKRSKKSANSIQPQPPQLT